MGIPSRITLVTLGVNDVGAATQFYERLGWQRSAASNEAVTFFHSNGTVLGLFERGALAHDANVENMPPGFSGVTLGQNFRTEEEVDAAFNHAIACGGRPLKTPQKVFWGGYSGYFADPDEHLWELAHNPFMPLDDFDQMTLPTT